MTKHGLPPVFTVWKLDGNVQARKRQVALSLSVAGLAVFGGIAVYQISKMLFSMITESAAEAQLAIVNLTAKINNNSADDDLPIDLELVDDAAGVYAHGSLQEVYYRRSQGGGTDWQWSFNGDDWYDTDDLGGDEAHLLDPPSMIFILRLHILSVARRKAAADAADAPGTVGAAGRKKAGIHIPAPVELPTWAQQQLDQHPGGSAEIDRNPQQRHILDAPDVICCPITGQIMLQPVVAPCGKTFEYEALRKWVVQHGTDPHTCQSLSVSQLYPNLVIRDMVERWLERGEMLTDASGSIQPAAVAAAATTTRDDLLQLHGHPLPHLDSDDPLSSFGMSSGSSSINSQDCG